MESGARAPRFVAPAGAASWLSAWGGLASLLAWSLGLGLLAVHLWVYLEHGLALVAYPYGVDQGEGYDAYSGWLLHLGQGIYTDNSLAPYYSSNYPPLYSYLVSVAMAWLGRSVGAARLVSVLAALGTAGLIGLVVWRRDRRAVAAVSAALLFLASTYVFHTTPLARVNATALFFAVLALALLERSRGRALGWAGLTFLAALYTKQTTLDAVAAGVGWLALAGRGREASGLALGVGTAGLALLAGLEWLSGGHFLTNVVVGNANPWSPQQALQYYANFAGLHGVVLALATAETVREARAGAPSLFGLYFVVALVFAGTAGKWGAGESYFLAPLAAGCVQAGKFLGGVDLPALARPSLGLALAVQAVLFAHGPLVALVPGTADRGVQARELGWTPRAEDVRAAGRLAAYAQRANGQVLMEDPGFLLPTSKPIVGNATHLRNLWEAGAWSATNLVEDIAARRFDLIVLDAQLYPPPVLEAIGRWYYLYERIPVRHREYLVFVPGQARAN